jgi:hypothetical protein
MKIDPGYPVVDHTGYLIINGSQQFSQIIGCNFRRTLSPDQDDFISYGYRGIPYVDHTLIHANRTDNGILLPTDQGVRLMG